MQKTKQKESVSLFISLFVAIGYRAIAAISTQKININHGPQETGKCFSL
jgi:hypothetical protein